MEFLSAPLGSTVAFYGLDLPTSSTYMGMREAAGERRPAAGKPL